jgi:hypothetical protein
MSILHRIGRHHPRVLDGIVFFVPLGRARTALGVDLRRRESYPPDVVHVFGFGSFDCAPSSRHAGTVTYILRRPATRKAAMTWSGSRHAQSPGRCLAASVLRQRAIR